MFSNENKAVEVANVAELPAQGEASSEQADDHSDDFVHNLNNKDEDTASSDDDDRLQASADAVIRLVDEADNALQGVRESRWQVYGVQWELWHRVEADLPGRDTLIKIVSRRLGREQVRTWNPRTKKPLDLVLALLKGVKTERSTKTNLRKAFIEAKNRKIAADRLAFCEWLRKVGGISGAAGLSATKSPAGGPKVAATQPAVNHYDEFESLIKQVRDLPAWKEDRPLGRVEMKGDPDKRLGGYSVTINRPGAGAAEVVPVFAITDVTIINAVMLRVLAEFGT